MDIYLQTLGNFLAYFVASVGLSAVFLGLYTWITPYREAALIHAGNRAAARSRHQWRCGECGFYATGEHRDCHFSYCNSGKHGNAQC
mgnify:CR=1 FL=1